MIDKIKSFLHNNNIFVYRIVKHSVIEFNVKFKNENHENLENKKIFYLIMFVSGRVTKRIILPPSSETVMKVILKQMIDENAFWINDRVDFKNEDAHLSLCGEYCNEFCTDINDYKRTISIIINEFIKCNDMLLIESKNKYIQHETRIIERECDLRQIHHEYMTILHVNDTDKKEDFIFASAKEVDELVDKLKIKKCQIKKTPFITGNSELKGNVAMSCPVIEIFLNILSQALSGPFIFIGRSFIKAEQFGKALASTYLSILDDPHYFNDHNLNFDSEGSSVKKKYLIKNGILVDCYNDLESATMLNLTPGNSFQDYSMNTSIASSTTLVVDIDRMIEPEEIDIFIDGVCNEHVNIDFITGDLYISLFGRKAHSTQIFSFLLSMNLLDLLKKIIGGYGEVSESSKFVTKEIVFNLN